MITFLGFDTEILSMHTLANFAKKVGRRNQSSSEMFEINYTNKIEKLEVYKKEILVRTEGSS